MTDSNATELLRKLLDEQGVKYEMNDDMGVQETSWLGFTVYQLTLSSKLIMHPTPEQAIAVTLGSVDKAEPQGADGNLDQSQIDWLRFMPDGWDGTPPTLEANDGSRWFELFGTPEKAARTLHDMPCGCQPCIKCPMYAPCCGQFGEGHRDALLEWLRGKVVRS